jgi:lipopolysaccharide exporter
VGRAAYPERLASPLRGLGNWRQHLTWVLGRGGTLREKAVRGSVWCLLSRVASRGADLIKIPILARLLSPEDFGVMGIALFAIACVETVTESGYQVALTQKSGDIGSYLGTARTVQALRGLALCLLACVAAPLLAAFFHATSSTGVIRGVGFLLLVRGLVNPATVSLSRQFDFQRIFWWTLVSEVIGAITGIVLAFWWRSVWALLASVLVAQAMNTLLSFRVVECRPSFEFDARKARELSRFGRWVLGSNAIIFVLVNGDDALVGRLFGPAAMGLYQMAYRMGNLAATEILGVIGRVALPAYSQLQSDREAVGSAYLQVVRLTALLALPIAAFVVFTAPMLVPILLGARWVAMVPLLQVLALYGALRAINSPVGSLYQSLSRPDLNAKIAVVQLTLLVLLLAVTVPLWHTMGVAVAVTVALALTWGLASWTGQRLVNGRLGEYVRALGPGCATALLMALLLWIARGVCVAGGVPTHVRLFVDVILSVGAAAIGLRLWGPRPRSGRVAAVSTSAYEGAS